MNIPQVFTWYQPLHTLISFLCFIIVLGGEYSCFHFISRKMEPQRVTQPASAKPGFKTRRPSAEPYALSGTPRRLPLPPALLSKS